MSTLDQPTAPSPAPGEPRRSGWAIMAALVLAEFVSSFESSMIYAALASFYRTFHDPIGVGWTVTGFMLVATISAAICGRLGDIFGRRRVLIVVLVGAVVGSLISAAAPDLTWVVIGRSIQGLAGAILPLCYGLVREHFPGTRMGVNIGIISATASAGGLLGVLLGGIIVDNGSWRLIFVFSASIATAAIAALLLIVPKGEPGGGDPIDWPGAILFVAGIGALLYALGLGESDGWGGTAQLSWAAGSLAALLVWVWWELRSPHPMIDVRLIMNRQIGLTLLTLLFVAIGSMNMNQIVMVMLQQPTSTGIGLGVSATAAGVYHMPASIFGIIASPLVGWYAARKGGRNGLILAAAVVSTAWVGMAVAHDSVALMTGWMALNGFGMGAIMAAAPNLIVEVAPRDRTSEATGLGQIVRKIGMACGAQLIAVSLATSTVRVGKGAFPDGDAYMFTYTWLAGACLIGLVLSLCLPRRTRREEAPPAPDASGRTMPEASSLAR